MATNANYLLAMIGARARRRFGLLLAGLDLAPSHTQILALLSEGIAGSQREIAGVLGLNEGRAVGLLDDLEERGLVAREVDPEDRRRRVVTLTAQGRRTVERVRRLGRDAEAETLAPLSEAEREQLRGLLRRLL
jgi:DNA-binding MarR family transcriptional regulator